MLETEPYGLATKVCPCALLLPKEVFYYWPIIFGGVAIVD